MKLNEGYSGIERYDVIDMLQNYTTIVLLSIPFASFRMFGFLDDIRLRTTAPGITSRHINRFFDEVQRSFYLAYLSGHGLKVKTLTLPNGMVGSVYLGAWRVSDSGLLTMSGLDSYLTSIFNKFNMKLAGTHNQFPAVYGDAIFPQSADIVSRYGMVW